MNIIFDGNYLFHKTFSVFSNYFKGESMKEILKNDSNKEMLLRKIIIDFTSTINRFKNKDKKVVFVFDSYSWRYTLYPNYKYALTKVKPDYYPEFLSVLEKLQSFLINKGFIVSKVQGAEGDDLMCIWSLYYGFLKEQETVIITGDSDITQLVSDKISVFCNNSKQLKFFCSKNRAKFWNQYFDYDLRIVEVNPLSVILKKVILGDSSDNIISVKYGFGEKSLKKFEESIIPINANDLDLISFAEWITRQFITYMKISEKEYSVYLEKIVFNLKMVWLNFSTYEANDFFTESGKSLLKEMLENVNENSDKYNYRGLYNLESIYNMLIK